MTREVKVKTRPLPEMLDEFYNSDMTVKSFNEIFNMSPIKNKDSELKVRIGSTVDGDKRLVGVYVHSGGGYRCQDFFTLKLKGSVKAKTKERLAKPTNPVIIDETLKLPGNVYKIYTFLNKYGPITGLSFIEKNLAIQKRTLRYLLGKMEKKKLIYRTKINTTVIVGVIK